jgi:hypothetical protein
MIKINLQTKPFFQTVFIFSILLILLSPLTIIAQSKVVNASAAVKKSSTGDLIYGKYGCTASKFSNGSYEFIPRGSLTISKGGKYTYFGFEKPSNGTFVVDEKGNLLFKGGYLDNGKAEKIDRPNKFLLVFPANLDNRWTCTLVK